MSHDRIPLLGLLADAVLPGETRVLLASALDPATFAAVRKAKPARLLALAVRTSAERTNPDARSEMREAIAERRGEQR